jgi:hypothetical protein
VIDRAVEPFVREVFTAVVAGDASRFERALAAVPDEHVQSSVNLAVAIDRTVMKDLHEETPSDDRLRSLANSFVQMQDWYQTEGLPVENFFRFLSDVPTGPLASDATGLLAFLTGGWLLVAFLDSGVRWYEYLDDILNRLDAGSGDIA